MKKNTLKLPQLAWNGACSLNLETPENWDVEICNMNGYNRPGLTPAQIENVIMNPVGVPPIRELARNRKQVVIIFDDIERATRVNQIVPFILKELAAAGIPDKNIRFVGANGCHGSMNRVDFVKKLGADVVNRFPVYNHNAFGCCVDVGKTSLGTQLKVNAEVMACDLKIAIGSVVPHAFAGFGGGAKIVLPGIGSFETCVEFHKLGTRFKKENPDAPIGTGIIEGNKLRANMEEAAAMIRLDIKIDAILNSYGETAALYAGNLKTEYPLAVNDAKTHYDTRKTKDKDIVIANSFAKVAECESGLEVALPAVSQKGGDVILIGNAPEGHVTHYLGGPWGNDKHNTNQMQVNLPANVNNLIIYNEYPDQTIFGYFAQPEKVKLISNWKEVLDILDKKHQNLTKVAVYPNSDIQYCSSGLGSNFLSFGDT